MAMRRGRRDATNTEEALLTAGRAVILESGFSGLSLRRVAAKAGVNLGMFPYLFGTKDAFVRRVAQRMYDEFFRGFALDTGRDEPPLANLRRGLIRFGRFSRDHRRLALSLLMDAAGGHALGRKFILDNGPRHGRVLVGLIRACQRAGTLVRVPLPVAMMHCMGAVAAPHLMLSAAESAGLPLPLRLLKPWIERVALSDEAIARRVDLALAGLRPGAPRVTP